MKLRSKTVHLAALLVVAAAVVGAPQRAQAQTLVRGPYLQKGTPTSMTIVWRTALPTDGRVQYGVDPSALKSVSDGKVATQHEVQITGLSAGTVYRYNVGTAAKVLAGGDAAHHFRTAPPVGSTKPFRFWVVGDSGTGGFMQGAVRDAMLNYVGSARPDIYLHLGDMAYGDGTDLQFQFNFFQMYQSILRNTVCWPTMGNHEGKSSRSGPQSGPYYDAYVLPKKGEAGGLASGTEAYYSFDYANVHFVVLDSHDSPRGPAGAMLTWLKADLAATQQKWLIAYWHHPPYTKGSHNSDTEGQLIDMRKHALPILEAAGVDLVLGGHSHVYERSWLVGGAYDTPTTAAGHIIDKKDGKLIGGAGAYVKSGAPGAVYIVAGHGGTGVKQNGTHPLMYFTEKANGSCIVDVEGNRLTLLNVRHDGQVTDRFTLVKGDALVLTAPDGGEKYSAGETINVTWKTVGKAIAKVDISYSIDDGKSWMTAKAGVANSGSASFTAPLVDSDQVRVRVADSASASTNDMSNGRITIAPSVPRKVVAFGGTWKYYDQGSDPGANWYFVSFDDSAWPSGKAQFGYGDNDEATKLVDASPNRPTVYFRKRIKLDGPVSAASLRVLHDDGFGVWINGKPVFAKYLPSNLGYASFATQSSAENEISGTGIDVSKQNPFVVGDNVIAVMVKQSSGGSSDVSFDFELTLTVAPSGPQLAPVPDQTVRVGQKLAFKLNARHPLGAAMTFSAKDLPTGAQLDAKSGDVTWTPTAAQLGVHLPTFTAGDATGRKASIGVKITVVAASGSGDGGAGGADGAAGGADSGPGGGGDAATGGGDDSGGCGCRSASAPLDEGAAATLLLAGLALLALRRLRFWAA